MQFSHILMKILSTRFVCLGFDVMAFLSSIWKLLFVVTSYGGYILQLLFLFNAVSAIKNMFRDLYLKND